jgi:hypothetical protein
MGLDMKKASSPSLLGHDKVTEDWNVNSGLHDDFTTI